MNPSQEIDKLLHEHATLTRSGKHLVYKLDTGKTFVKAHTPSDHRTGQNDLSTLRRALGINSKGEPMHPPITTTESTSYPPPAVPIQVVEPVELAIQPSEPLAQSSEPLTQPSEPAPVNSLESRIKEAIAAAEEKQEMLMLEAQLFESRAAMLQALLPFASDPTTEGALRAVLGVAVAAKVAPAAAAMPLPPVSVIVTRDLVLASCRALDKENFTLDHIIDDLAGDRPIGQQERTRVRSSIQSAMYALAERGLAAVVEKGFGRRPAVWTLSTQHAPVSAPRLAPSVPEPPPPPPPMPTPEEPALTVAAARAAISSKAKKDGPRTNGVKVLRQVRAH